MLSVITAHLVGTVNATGIRMHIATVKSWFGQVGVIVFLILGGWLFHFKNQSYKVFWKRKAQLLIVPWIICGTGTYILCAFLSKNSSLTSYIRWVIGSGSWYYYMSIYIFFLLLFQKVRNRWIVKLMIPITLISLLLTDLNVIPYTECFTKYLNPANFVGFFAIGILLQQETINEAFFKKHRNKAALACLLSVAVMAVRQKSSYFCMESAVFEVSAAMLVLYLAYTLSKTRTGWKIGRFGKDTFFIYLTHMQIVQAIGTRLPDTLLFDVLKPVIGLAVMLAFASAIRWIGDKFLPMKKARALIGLR